MTSASLPLRITTAADRYGAVWLYGLVLTVVILFVYFTPHSDRDVAVFVLPFSGRADAALIVARADGQIVDVARWPFIVQAHAGRAHDPQFVNRLYGAGALLVISPGIAAGCFKRD